MLVPDFQEFYGVDLGELWTGGLGVRRALILTWGLLDIAGSRFRAAWSGGPQFLGWDDERYLLADTRDAVMAIALGFSEAPADFSPWSRPTKGEPAQAQTIAEFDVPGFMRKLAT